MTDYLGHIVRKGDYIAGSFVKPEHVSGYINGVNPGDRSDQLGRFPFSDHSVERAVEAAREAQVTWRAVPLTDRCAAIQRFRKQIHAHEERLVHLVSRETGRPFWEVEQEIASTLYCLDQWIEHGAQELAERPCLDLHGHMSRVPRGVVVVVAPYCFPVHIPAVQTAAAVLSGCAVVCKNSKFAPGVGQRIAELWDCCRLPRGVVNFVQGSGGVVGQKLVTHPDVAALLLTGSYSTSRSIRKALAGRENLPVFTQSGGKGAAMVLEGADLEWAAQQVAFGAFLTAGQRHDNTARVLVDDAVYPAFVQALIAHTNRLRVGYGADEDTFMGPLISDNLRVRYRRYCRDLVQRGHRPLVEPGNHNTGRRGFYVRPAVFDVRWTRSKPFIHSEPPGPVLQVYRVGDVDEAVLLHNRMKFRRCTSVFADPGDQAVASLPDQLSTSSIHLNLPTTGSSLRLPSTGLGRSAGVMPGGLGLVSTLTYIRTQLERVDDATDISPGWAHALPGETTDETEDLSGSLEPVGD